jgi:hypothetical protein
MSAKNLEDCQKQYLESLARFTSLVGIKWLESNEFWKIYDEEYKSQKRFFMHDVIPIKLTMDEIRARIQIAPNFTPPEEDFPGPVERWYGVYKEHLFLLTHYYGTGNENLILCEGEPLAIELVQEGMEKFKRLNPY